MEESLFDLIEKRFSCRKFVEGKVIDRQLLIKCIEAARLAPSASNSQPWKYIIVDERTIKDSIIDNLSIGNVKVNQFARTSSALIIAVEESKNVELAVGQVLLGRSFAQFDIGCSVMQLALQATELGLATCILGMFNEKNIKKILKIPNNKKIIVVIAIGFPSEEPPEKKRKELSRILSFNNYDNIY